MVIVGVLLIFAVLLDAFRRVREERRSGVRISLGKSVGKAADVDDDDILLNSELPNGGARAVARDLYKQVTQKSTPDTAQVEHEAPEPAYDDDDLIDGISAEEEDHSAILAEREELDDLCDEPQADTQKVTLPEGIEPEMFVLNVVARDPAGFNGEDILHILLACNLRFGEMDFFHRHEQETGRGTIQFSVANMMQPGVFDIDNMADLRTPGLVFFRTFPGPKNMMQAFDYMLETAKAVAKNLNGDVLDESRSMLTRQTLEHARSRIQDLERRLMAASEQ
ncbi:MAG: cell division protein ZipA [Gammaproteobacteria bacterium]|nr:MAG: cell division protein ZipA [Gammaproteobacteria bacterium]